MDACAGVKMSAHYCGPHMSRADLDGERQGGLEHPRSKEVSGVMRQRNEMNGWMDE